MDYLRNNEYHKETREREKYKLKEKKQSRKNERGG